MARKLVLFADDNKNLLIAAERALKDAGYDVMTSSSGADTIAKLATDPPDVLVLDWIMPINGGEVLRQLGSNAPPVVVITGDPVRAEDVRSIHVRRVLTKPFELPELLSAIEDVLDDSGLIDTKEDGPDEPPPLPMTDEERSEAHRRFRRNNGPAHA